LTFYDLYGILSVEGAKMRKTNRRAEWAEIIAALAALVVLLYGVGYGAWTFLDTASKHAGSL